MPEPWMLNKNGLLGPSYSSFMAANGNHFQGMAPPPVGLRHQREPMVSVRFNCEIF